MRVPDGRALPEYAGIFSTCSGPQPRGAVQVPAAFELARRRADRSARDIAEASRRGGEVGCHAARIKAAARSSIGVRLGQGGGLVPGQVPDKADRVRRFGAVREGRGEGRALRRGGRARSCLSDTRVSYATGAQIVPGDRRRRASGNASALASYAGLNSSVSQSGQFDSGGGPITNTARRTSPRFVAGGQPRQAVRPGLRAHDKKRAEGKFHRVAVTAVARKLCHIAFAVMRDQVLYDPGRNRRSMPIVPSRRPRRPLRHARKHSIFGSQAATFG